MLDPGTTKNDDGRRVYVTPDLKAAWRTASRKAGVTGMLTHVLRTAVRNMERTGVPRSVATKLTGHRTESLYRRYAIVSDADLCDASAKLAPGTFPGTVTATAPRSRGIK